MGVRSLFLALIALTALVAQPQPAFHAALYGEPALDPLESPQWSLALINASGAWALLPGAHDAPVAIVDSGADLGHADLLGTLWEGNALHGAIVAHPFGWGTRIPREARTTQDADGHGTLVAGVVGAASGNALGIRGVADVPLMIVKYEDVGAPPVVAALAEGIVWAVDHGARVVCVSQVVSLPSTELDAAIAHAEANGVVVVAASGNDGSAASYWPAAYATVLSVGAVDAAGGVWSGSTHGKVDLAAPGVDVVTTALPNRYAAVTGTSLAAPHVAAAAALVLAADPALTAAEVRAILISTALPTGDARAGAGLLDVGAAVEAALA